MPAIHLTATAVVGVVGKAFLGRALAGTVKAVEAHAAGDDEATPS